MLCWDKTLTAILVNIYEGENKIMADYEKMYGLLCRAADDALSIIEDRPQDTAAAAELLRAALLAAEDVYISSK